MKFVINYPSKMIEPKGLHIPCREDIEAAVRLTEIALNYFPDIDYLDEEFKITVTDEICIFQGKLVSCDTSEGLLFYPSDSGWSVDDIFETILYALTEV